MGGGDEGVRLDLEEVEGTLSHVRRSASRAALALVAAACAGCLADRVGWGSRGRYWEIVAAPTVQVRRGPQILDARTGELSITWVGARAPEGSPPILRCDLLVFDDRDGDGAPEPAEILAHRESLESTRKILFAEVRIPASPGARRLRARIEVETERERRSATWTPASD